jgi:hypothetical protein
VCSGVLDVAAAIVQLLRRFFAEQIDDLKPEQAFLEVGCQPLLLSRHWFVQARCRLRQKVHH